MEQTWIMETYWIISMNTSLKGFFLGPFPPSFMEMCSVFTCWHTNRQGKKQDLCDVTPMIKHHQYTSLICNNKVENNDSIEHLPKQFEQRFRQSPICSWQLGFWIVHVICILSLCFFAGSFFLCPWHLLIQITFWTVFLPLSSSVLKRDAVLTVAN